MSFNSGSTESTFILGIDTLYSIDSTSRDSILVTGGLYFDGTASISIDYGTLII
ncbi:MAG: hypothetical protein R2813_07155 [Flavobacteriales bacterium]